MLVDTIQLRASTVMFIDDNPNVRAEVAAMVPGIQVKDVEFYAHLYYQILGLREKTIRIFSVGSSNTSFLRPARVTNDRHLQAMRFFAQLRCQGLY